MAPNPHVEQRLAARVLPVTAERAFEVLRYPKRLAALIAQVPELAHAARVSIPLTPAQDAPRLVVDRDGSGVTCLAAGMASSAPDVPWPTVERYLSVQAERLRVAVASRRLVQASDAGRNPLLRALHFGYRMTRAEFDQVRALSPLLHDFVTDHVMDIVRKLPRWSQDLPRHRGGTDPLDAAWRLYTSACHLLMASGHEERMGDVCLVAAMAGDVHLATRGTWWCINQPERTLSVLARMLQASTAARQDTMPSRALAVWTLAQAPLVAISQRFRHLQREAAELMEACCRAAGDTADVSPARRAEWVDFAPFHTARLCLIVSGSYFHTVLPMADRERWTQRLRQAYPALEPAPGRSLPDLADVAAGVSPGLGHLVRGWQPLRDFGVARSGHPVPSRSWTPEDLQRNSLWRMALHSNLVTPSANIRGIPLLLSLAPMEALVPADTPDSWWRLAEGVHYLREALPKVVQVAKPPPVKPVTRAAVPGPNEPCACGSGQKYKKCCGRTA